MCSLENVRVFVDQRLAAFAEEMFEVIERTMREFEEQLRRQQDLKLLTAAFQPQVRIHRTDVQQLTLSEDVPPEQQQRSISLKQEEAPELLNFKEEEEEPGTGPTSTQLPVTVKVKEEHEEEPQPTQLPPRDHINDAAFDEDSGDGEGLDDFKQQHEKQDSSDKESDGGSWDWEDPVERRSGLILQHEERCGGGTSAGSSDLQGNLVQVPTEENPSSFGGNRQNLRRTNKKQKPRRHVGSERYTCLICNKTFTRKVSIERHMAVHIVEKPLRCSLSGTSSTTREGFQTDLRPRNPEAGNQVPMEENPTPQQNLERTQREPSRTKGEEQLMPIKAELSPGLEQDQSPELPQVKDEQEDVGTSQEGEQLGALAEAPRIQVTLPLVPENSEGDENRLVQKPSGVQMSCSVCGKTFSTQFNLSRHTEHFHGEKLVSCSVCEKSFRSLFYLKQHMAVHKKKSFSCSVCKKAFASKLHLRRHTEHFHGETLVNCSVCEKSFRSLFCLKQHMDQHTEQKPFSCPVCKKAFASRLYVRRHMTCHQEEKPFSCSVCKKAFASKMYLRNHMMCHKDEKPFSCSVCNRSYRRKIELTRHMFTHDRETKFRCSVCKKGFALEIYLRRHMTCHKEDKPFSCSVCKKAFASKMYLRQHMMRHMEDKPFSCSVCNKTFPRRTDLRRHMFSHMDEKQFSCPICQKTFMHKDSVYRHFSTHHKEEPLSCPVCNMTFLRWSDLTKHSHIHKEEKPFSCPVCQKAFALQVYVKYHMVCHLREKPLSCPVCNMKFFRRSDFTRHTYIHKEEKPFSCPVCKKSFAKRYLMWSHMVYHKDKTFSCSVCKKAFPRKADMTRHMLKHRKPAKFVKKTLHLKQAPEIEEQEKEIETKETQHTFIDNAV
ncbi:uncharacterized protein V6R79_003372 [Siganus canaliculatus]